MDIWIDFQKSLARRSIIENLDIEQTRGKKIRPEGAAIARGVAGSGKSLVLRNRVEKLLGIYDDILILTYNRFMSGWLRGKLEEKDIAKQVYCSTFHQWAGKTLDYKYDWDRDEHTRRKIIKLAKESNLKYQAILIDEAQDFYDEWFQMLLEILDPKTESLFFVYDNTQSVYGHSHRRQSDWSWKNLGIDIAGGRSSVFDLNYRNAPEILDAAWNFIQPILDRADMKVEKRDRDADGKVISTPKITSIIQPKKKASRSSEIEPLLLEIFYEDMPSQIAQQVKAALATHSQSSIGILTEPSAKELRQEISQELKHLKIPHHAPNSSEERDGNVVQRPYIIIDSWSALKGVEFDAVIIAGVDRIQVNSDRPEKDFQVCAGLYTAMTRARDHLVMLYEAKNAIVELLEDALTADSVLETEE
jgi:superfamily I DNA/RNA helicase